MCRCEECRMTVVAIILFCILVPDDPLINFILVYVIILCLPFGQIKNIKD